MKKILFTMVSAALAGVAFAAANDTLITFSTKGPDTYANGDKVLPGECYALVFDKDGEPFTVAADGTTTGGEIVLVAPVARKGRCPKVLFEVDAALASTKYAEGGSWKVYLLDTRRYGANGTTLAPLKNGKPTLVNAAGVVCDAAITLSSGAQNSLAVDSSTTTATASELPAGFDKQPKIAGIDFFGDKVFVTVENTVPYLAYDLSEGGTPDDVSKKVNDPRTGGDDGTVVLVAPKKDGGAFFRVGRN